MRVCVSYRPVGACRLPPVTSGILVDSLELESLLYAFHRSELHHILSVYSFVRSFVRNDTRVERFNQSSCLSLGSRCSKSIDTISAFCHGMVLWFLCESATEYQATSRQTIRTWRPGPRSGRHCEDRHVATGSSGAAECCSRCRPRCGTCRSWRPSRERALHDESSRCQCRSAIIVSPKPQVRERERERETYSLHTSQQSHMRHRSCNSSECS